jgi:insertion element IS1 protein InsB
MHTRPRCGTVNRVKNDRDYKGAQKLGCNDGGRYGTLQQRSRDPVLIRPYVERAVRERVSLRGIERGFGISRRTVSRWLEKWIERWPALTQSLVAAHADDLLELDELWSFVGSKARQRWLWLALCRRTRQVVAYWLGDQSETGAVHLWE